MSHRFIRRFLLVLSIGYCFITDSAFSEEDATKYVAPPDTIYSLLMRDRYVFASTHQGLYKASIHDKQWHPLNLPKSMPIKGTFVQSSTDVIYYFKSQVYASLSEKKEQNGGLYRSDDFGATWKVLSDEYDFRNVFIHPNGTFYAITETVKEIASSKKERKKNSGKSDDETIKVSISDRVLQSNDGGYHWRDIRNNIAKGYRLYSIFQDPDHPDLVCVDGNCMRGYVFQATDTYYNWKPTVEWEWRKKNKTEETLFHSQNYHTTTALYMLNARLSNYFQYPFKDSPSLPAFDLKTTPSRRRFNIGEPIPVAIEVNFLLDSPEVKLLDQVSGEGCWGLNRVFPDGRMETVGSSYSARYYKADASARSQFRQNVDIQTITFGKDKPYKRSIDLTKICDFSKTGKYKIQLFYSVSGFNNRENEEWGGSFAGPVFEVIVSDAP